MKELLKYELIIIIYGIIILGWLVIMYIIYRVGVFIFNLIGNIYKPIWIIVEYSYYRTEFKEFLKDKKI